MQGFVGLAGLSAPIPHSTAINIFRLDAVGDSFTCMVRLRCVVWLPGSYHTRVLLALLRLGDAEVGFLRHCVGIALCPDILSPQSTVLLQNWELSPSRMIPCLPRSAGWSYVLHQWVFRSWSASRLIVSSFVPTCRFGGFVIRLWRLAWPLLPGTSPCEVILYLYRPHCVMNVVECLSSSPVGAL